MLDQGKGAPIPIAAEKSRVDAGLALEYRQKGLLWYSVYVVDFAGVYTFRNPGDEAHAIYDGLAIDVDGRPLPFVSSRDGASVSAVVEPRKAAAFRMIYRSQGLEYWRYNPGDDVTQTRDFELTMKTNFKEIDFPLSTLAPTEKREDAAGWELIWKYRNLISGFQIGMTMPEKLQPGPLAGEISRFAPVSLLLFFLLMFILTTLRNIDLHPMNYVFLAAAFFAFHLLLAYLVDHVSIQLAFLICSVVSVGLVVSYLRLVAGPRFAFSKPAGATDLSRPFFVHVFPEGFTGLAITVGCVVTLFVVMQVTGHVRWKERFAAD